MGFPTLLLKWLGALCKSARGEAFHSRGTTLISNLATLPITWVSLLPLIAPQGKSSLYRGSQSPHTRRRKRAKIPSIFHLRAWANVICFLQTRGKVKRSPRRAAKPEGLRPRSAKTSESHAPKAHSSQKMMNISAQKAALNQLHGNKPRSFCARARLLQKSSKHRGRSD